MTVSRLSVVTAYVAFAFVGAIVLSRVIALVRGDDSSSSSDRSGATGKW